MKPYRGVLKPGNFKGSGGDLLLGTASWTTLFRFNPQKEDWEWLDSDGGQTNVPGNPLSYVHPYAGNLMIGDFDNDGRDELLGISGQWVTLFGIRNSGSFEWLTSNSGNAEAAMSTITPYQNKVTVGRFNSTGRATALGIGTHSALFGFEGASDMRRIWGSETNRLAGIGVTASDKKLVFNPLREMPCYLLVIPDISRKASMIAFDPVLNPHL